MNTWAPITELIDYGTSTANNFVIVFTPFFNTDTIGYYAAILIGLSLAIIAIMYARPIQIAFEKEMIETLRVQIQAKRRKMQITAGIVFSFLIGIIPLSLYILMMVIPSSTMFYSVLHSFSPLFDALTIISPFLLAFSIIKWLGEKKSGWFARFCSMFVTKTSNSMKHVVVRNIEGKSSKIVKLVIIVIITIAFGLTVKISNQSLTNYQVEQARISLGSDISVSYSGNSSFLYSINYAIDKKSNVSASCSLIQAPIEILNQSEYFSYQSFSAYITNLTQVAAASTMLKDKYLSAGSWASIIALSKSVKNIALLPVNLEDHIQGSSITVGISITNNHSVSFLWNATFQIAGYYKAFPGVTDTSSSSYYYSQNPVIGWFYIGMRFYIFFASPVNCQWHIETR